MGVLSSRLANCFASPICVWRNGWSRWQFALAFLISQSVLGVAFAQSAQKLQNTIEERPLTTEDLVELKMTYYKSTGGKNAPVVILLHGKTGVRQGWKGFASVLQDKAGFAVIAVDLRGFGESHIKSKKPDYQAMAINDLEAIKAFLFDEHQKGALNMNKLGIVGCQFSASVAMFYTEYDWLKEPFEDSAVPSDRTPRGQDVQALVLISPEASTPGLFTSRTATSLRNIDRLAVMVATSDKSSDVAASKKLFDQISLKRVKSDLLSFKKYPEGLSGMDLLLKDDDLKDDIAQFLIKHVHDHDSKWIDRRSRLDRE